MFPLMPLIFALCMGGLWRKGGDKWFGWRDIFIPVAMMAYWWLDSGMFWIGVLTGGATNIIHMGYGDKSWLKKVLKDSWKVRGAYGFITSFCIGLFPAIYNTFFLYNEFEPVEIWSFVGYVVFNTCLEIALNLLEANVWWTEIGNGFGRGSIVLWVK